jgi:hypothetical protein
MPFLHRYLGNPLLSSLGKLFFHSPINDFHCGMRGFKTASARSLRLRSPGMEFASEMIVKATHLRLRIAEIPITLRKDRRGRRPHLNTWRDGWRHLRFLLLYRPRWLFFYPGMAMLLVGVIAFSMLASGPVVIGGVGFDTNTLLVSACLLLLGAQLVAFALFAKAYGVVSGFLPADPVTLRILRGQPFEMGIIAGAAAALAGFAELSRALRFWEGAGFGALPYAESLRMTIPAVTFITLGAQLMFAGFMLALLKLHFDA